MCPSGRELQTEVSDPRQEEPERAGAGPSSTGEVAPGPLEPAPKQAAPSPFLLLVSARRSSLSRRKSVASPAVAAGPSAGVNPGQAGPEGRRREQGRPSWGPAGREASGAHRADPVSDAAGRGRGEAQAHPAVGGGSPGGVPGDTPGRGVAGTQRRSSFTLLSGPWWHPTGAAEETGGRAAVSGGRSRRSLCRRRPGA